MHLNVGYFASVGGKAAQEDRLVCIPDMSTVPGLLEIVVPPEKKISYFAVFDGHGGSRCSSFLAAEFHVELARHKKIASQPITALRETWKGMDELFYRNCMKEVGGDEMAIVSDGSTATVALVVGDELYMLNCGDSAGGVITTEGKIVFMTEDHGTHNPIEAVRVVSNGGMLREQGVTFRRPFPCCCFSTARQAKQRLYPGGLLVTRSFGDFNAKINVLGGIKGVVIHDHGEVKYKKLDHGVKSIILASDGLWDGLMLMQIEDILQGKSVGRQSGKVSTDRELDETAFQGYNTEIDDNAAAQAYAIGKAATMSPTWRTLGSSPDNTSVLLVNIGLQ